MPKFGLLGFPISHSLSPRLFKAAYDGRFRYDLIENESFEESFQLFMRSYDAVNVTAPFKEMAFEKAKFPSSESELIGAANILVKTPRGLSCFNSDCSAVSFILGNLDEKLFAETGEHLRNVLVVGCGGAGKAAVVAAYMRGMNVKLMNRNMARALTFAQRLSAKGPSVLNSLQSKFRDRRPGIVSVLPIERFSEALSTNDVLIYTAPSPLEAYPFNLSSFGLVPVSDKSAASIQPVSSCNTDSQASVNLSSESFAGPPSSYNQGLKFILEANYRNPSFTPKVLSILPDTMYIGGQEWLLQQAITGYGLMCGINPNPQALYLETYK